MHPAAAHSCLQKHPSEQHGGTSSWYPNAPHCHGQKQGGETRAEHETSPRKRTHYSISNILKSSGPTYPLRLPAGINKNTSRLPQQLRIRPSCWGSTHGAPRSSSCVSCPASWCPTPQGDAWKTPWLPHLTSHSVTQRGVLLLLRDLGGVTHPSRCFKPAFFGCFSAWARPGCA